MSYMTAPDSLVAIYNGPEGGSPWLMPVLAFDETGAACVLDQVDGELVHAANYERDGVAFCMIARTDEVSLGLPGSQAENAANALKVLVDSGHIRIVDTSRTYQG